MAHLSRPAYVEMRFGDLSGEFLDFSMSVRPHNFAGKGLDLG